MIENVYAAARRRISWQLQLIFILCVFLSFFILSFVYLFLSHWLIIFCAREIFFVIMFTLFCLHQYTLPKWRILTLPQPALTATHSIYNKLQFQLWGNRKPFHLHIFFLLMLNKNAIIHFLNGLDAFRAHFLQSKLTNWDLFIKDFCRVYWLAYTK